MITIGSGHLQPAAAGAAWPPRMDGPRAPIRGRTWTVGLAFMGVLLLASAPAWAGPNDGEAVVVLFNQRVPASESVAAYYARRRQVPTNQVLGLNLPADETMSRADYNDRLRKPLLKELERYNLFCYDPKPAETVPAGQRLPREAKIRYLVLCFGVPLRIAGEAGLIEEDTSPVRTELRRNEAALDSELACLPWNGGQYRLTGPRPNPLAGTTNASSLHPTNGLLMVARLDGPTADIARGLVDQALEAETNGLWGRAYIDLRGTTDSNLAQGEAWLAAAAQAFQRFGFVTIVDTNAATFPAAFPMSHIAFYAGWYDPEVSGPFARPQVEFMPGAFAYHLFSFSARTLRNTNQSWAATFLAKGATATMGFVAEPYLGGTPDMGAFAWRFVIGGFTYGEAAYAAQNVLSWQTTVVGDPLYRPFAKKPQVLHAELEQRASTRAAWSHLRVMEVSQNTGLPAAQMVEYLEKLPLTRQSAVLKEKLAELYWSQNQYDDAFEAWEIALRRDPSPLQRLRILLRLLVRQSDLGRHEKAFAAGEQVLKEWPDYPDRPALCRTLADLARKLGRPEAAEKYQAEPQRPTR